MKNKNGKIRSWKKSVSLGWDDLWSIVFFHPMFLPSKIFVVAMKYFNILGIFWWVMKHFCKIFDGPRNILLCSIFKLKGLKHKIFKLAIKEI